MERTGRRSAPYDAVRWMSSRFTYEEEATPEDFFVPVVWGLVVSDSLIPWQHATIALFASSAASHEVDERIEDDMPQGNSDGTQLNGLDVV